MAGIQGGAHFSKLKSILVCFYNLRNNFQVMSLHMFTMMDCRKGGGEGSRPCTV